MAAAGEQRGREYLERHRIPELLHSLGALLLYHRPERPREFLIQVLESVKAGKLGEGKYPCLMDDSNLTAMFEMMDVAGQGYITSAQYKEEALGNSILTLALKTLGLSTEGLHSEDDATITLDTFKEEANKKMLESWAIY